MNKRTMTKVAAMAMLLAALSPVTSFATTANGASTSLTVSGVTYTGHAATVSNGSKITGRVEASASKSVGAGYIKTLVKLYKGTQQIGETSGYNGATTNLGYSTYTIQGQSGSDYRTTGSFGGYNSVTGYYSTRSVAYSPNVRCYASIVDRPVVLDSDLLGYRVTADGETYGSALGEESVGYLPDWISAQASNGESGYIKLEDYWVPEAENPADAVENYAIERVRSIPVYEAPESDVVVGFYDMYYGG